MTELIQRFESLVREHQDLLQRYERLDKRQSEQVTELNDLYSKLQLWQEVYKNMYYAPQERVWCLPQWAIEGMTDTRIRDLARQLFKTPPCTPQSTTSNPSPPTE